MRVCYPGSHQLAPPGHLQVPSLQFLVAGLKLKKNLTKKVGRKKSGVRRNMVVALKVQWTPFTSKSDFQIYLICNISCVRVQLSCVFFPFELGW